MPYGSDVTEILRGIQDSLSVYAVRVVEEFYHNLMQEEHAAKILSYLSSAEVQHLQTQQSKYLAQILHPTLTRDAHEKMAAQVGARHAVLGVPGEVLAQSFHIYRNALDEVLDVLPDATQVRGIILERLSYDLSWQLMEYAELERKQMAIIELLDQFFSTVLNRVELLQQTMLYVMQIPGIQGASVITVSGDTLVWEISDGVVLQSASEGGPSPLEDLLYKVWTEERLMRVNSIHQEAGMSELWEQAKRLDIRTFSIWPVVSISGAPIGLFVLYSRWPGYFDHTNRHNYYHSLIQRFGQVLDTIGTRRNFSEGTHPLSQQERQHYRQLLRDGALEMWYQPIVDPNTHQALKVEALARLRDNDQWLRPAQFLPAFNYPQLFSLFMKGLEQVTQDLFALEKEGFHLGASINLPTETFSNDEFFKQVLKMGERYASRYKLTLEIIEIGLLEQVSTQEKIRQLKQVGFRISMDDIGSGDSTLLRLQSLSVDEIKVDQGFVRFIDQNLSQLHFIMTLIQLSADLQVECVVEGVETHVIMDMMASVSASNVYLQGYAFARPLPFLQLVAWLKENQFTVLPSHPNSILGIYVKHLQRMTWLLHGIGDYFDIWDIERLSDPNQCSMMHFFQSASLTNSKAMVEAHDDFHRSIGSVVRNLKNQIPRQQAFGHLFAAHAVLKEEVVEYTKRNSQ